MPIYMDRHYSEDATRQAITVAHEKDLAIQEKYNCKFLTYWFDEERHTSFCLIEAPSKEALQNAPTKPMAAFLMKSLKLNHLSWSLF